MKTRLSLIILTIAAVATLKPAVITVHNDLAGEIVIQKGANDYAYIQPGVEQNVAISSSVFDVALASDSAVKCVGIAVHDGQRYSIHWDNGLTVGTTVDGAWKIYCQPNKPPKRTRYYNGLELDE